MIKKIKKVLIKENKKQQKIIKKEEAQWRADKRKIEFTNKMLSLRKKIREFFGSPTQKDVQKIEDQLKI